MREVIRWQADDGQVFDKKIDCELYEKRFFVKRGVEQFLEDSDEGYNKLTKDRAIERIIDKKDVLIQILNGEI